MPYLLNKRRKAALLEKTYYKCKGKEAYIGTFPLFIPILAKRLFHLKHSLLLLCR